MRFVIGVVLALSVGIGAYFGSARAAGSATERARTVTLRIGDVAVVGQVRCLAYTESRIHPIRYAYLRCSHGKRIRAAYWADVTVGGIDVWQKGVPSPVFTATG